jgi:gliding motility-associated lipoprotein GldH
LAGIRGSYITSRRLGAVLCFLVAVLCLTSCDKNRIYEKNEQIKNYTWDYTDVKTFDVDIKDTSAHYNILLNMRHSFQYEWRNTWVSIVTQYPDGTTYKQRVNVVLYEADGHPLGDCLGDNCDMQVYFQHNVIFPKPGKYTFKVAQDMRVNPLKGIKSIGLRVEKNQPANNTQN